jgi:hypothetical protein
VAVIGITGAADHWSVIYHVTAKTLGFSTPQAGPGSDARSTRFGRAGRGTASKRERPCWLYGSWSVAEHENEVRVPGRPCRSRSLVGFRFHHSRANHLTPGYRGDRPHCLAWAR